MARRRSTHALGYEETQASIDREDAMLRQRRAVPTTAPSDSERLHRCASCGQWPRWKDTAFGRLCVGDGGPGHPYEAAPPRGSARMGPG